MKRNKIAAVLLGMGLMAGALALPVTVPTTTTYAATATQVIGHGEWQKQGGHWYYYQDGKMLKDCWVKDGIDWYYLNADGTMKADEFVKIDNDWYYFRSWGGMQYNNWYQNPKDGNWYYFRSWGGALNTGWNKIGIDWYYFDADAKMLHDQWIQQGDDWYYLRSWGGRMYSQWGKVGIDWYRFDANGKMLSDEWYKEGNDWYYLRSWGGRMYSQWGKVGIDWYRFDANGKMLSNEWYKEGNDWYYLRSWGGRMYSQWGKVGIDWYRFDANGKMLSNEWYQEGDNWYYLRSWGGRCYNQKMTIDGKVYVFDGNGHATPKPTATPDPTPTVTPTPKPTETPDPTPTETPDPTPTETPEVVKVESITISGNKDMTAGDSQKLTAAVKPENAANKKLSWKSSDEAVASVSDGTVTAKKAGTATITATAADGSGVSGSIKITVKEAAVEATELYVVSADGELGGKTTLTEIGQTAQLTAKILPENTTDKSVTWQSSDTSVVTVDKNGVVTAVGEGWTYVGVKTANGLSNSAIVEVTLPKTDEDYLNRIVYDEEMSRQVFDLVNQQRVLEGHLEMEWSDGFDKDQAIAVAGNNLLNALNGNVTGTEEILDSLSDHNGSQNGAGGQKKNLAAEDIFEIWMNSPAHKSNQMADGVKSSAYVVMYVPYDDGSKLFSAIATLSYTDYDPEAEKDYVWNGDPYMNDFMTEDTYNMILDHFKK